MSSISCIQKCIVVYRNDNLLKKCLHDLNNIVSTILLRTWIYAFYLDYNIIDYNYYTKRDIFIRSKILLIQ